MNRISQWLESTFNIHSDTQVKILVSLIVIISLWLLKHAILKVVFRRTEGVKERYYWRNGVNYVNVGVGLILVSLIWFKEFRSMATFLGLLSAGLAIALKDPIVNLVAWLFIMLRRPFEVGDRMQIGNFSGDVIDIRLFQFTLNEIGNWVDADQSTGRIIHIPNGRVFTEGQANYTRGFNHIWHEMPVLVTFESNWEKAKALLGEIVDHHAAHLTEKAKKELLEASRKYMIFYKTLSPIVYTSVKDSGVLLTIRYLIAPRSRRMTEQSIWEEILREFAKHDDIDFAYPTQRIYYNPREGKPGAGKSPGLGGESL